MRKTCNYCKRSYWRAAGISFDAMDGQHYDYCSQDCYDFASSAMAEKILRDAGYRLPDDMTLWDHLKEDR